MKRSVLFTGMTILPVLALLIATAGCGGGGDKGKDKPTADGVKKPAAAKAAKEELAVTGWKGVLKGKVTFEGDAPARGDATSEIKKLGNEADRNHCLKGDTSEQTWKVGPDKGVANVVVWLRPSGKKYFNLPDDQRTRADEVKVDQPFCTFEPHVVVVYPNYFDPKSKSWKETGQKFRVYNSAPITHNTNLNCADDSQVIPPGFNPLLAPNQKMDVPVAASENKDSVLVTFACNVHGFMKGFARVFDHPFAAVSSGDTKDAKEFGAYEIKNAPTGAELEVVYWHESMDKPKVLEKITLKEGEEKVVNIPIKKP